MIMFNCTVSNVTVSPKSSKRPPLSELGNQEVEEHCPPGYLWCQCAERPTLWSEPGLINLELEEDCPCQ